MIIWSRIPKRNWWFISYLQVAWSCWKWLSCRICRAWSVYCTLTWFAFYSINSNVKSRYSGHKVVISTVNWHVVVLWSKVRIITTTVLLEEKGNKHFHIRWTLNPFPAFEWWLSWGPFHMYLQSRPVELRVRMKIAGTHIIHSTVIF